MTVARRFVVRGRVQGVGFRYFAVRAARRCGVVGTVRNISDGSVEAVAEGPAASVSAFREELERGPSFGSVGSVDESELTVTGRFKSFDVVF
jgi:acylphosphatase